jgi:hypothetical protein
MSLDCTPPGWRPRNGTLNTPGACAARVLLRNAELRELAAAVPLQPSAANWERLVEEASEEGLIAVLAEQLARLPGWTPYTAGQQRAGFLRTASVHKLLAELASMLRTLGCHGLVFKGAALMCTVYAPHPGLRQMGDVDLWVAPARGPAVERALTDVGFRRISEGVFGRDTANGPQLIDLHRDILNAHWVPSRRRAYHLDAEELMKRSEALSGHLEGLRFPCPIDHLLLLSVHALKHSHSRLFWLLDIALLLRLCPAEELKRQARASGTERALAYCLTLLQSVFDVAPPLATPHFKMWERCYLAKVAERSEVHGAGELLVAMSLPDWQSRWRYLFELARPRSGKATEIPGRLKIFAQRARSLARSLLARS